METIITKLKKEKESLQKSITVLNDNHSFEVKKIKKELENKITSIDNELKLTKAQLIQLEDERKVLSENQSRLSNQQITELINKHKDEIKQLKNIHALEINEMKLKYDSHLANLKIDNMNLKSYKETNEELQEKIQQLQLKLSKQNEHNMKKEQEFKNIQIETFQKMKKNFIEAMTVLQEKNENLNQEIKELESYLHNRPSREEDLGEIAKLQKELKHKTKELKDLKAFIASTNGITNNTPNNHNNIWERCSIMLLR